MSADCARVGLHNCGGEWSNHDQTGGDHWLDSGDVIWTKTPTGDLRGWIVRPDGDIRSIISGTRK